MNIENVKFDCKYFKGEIPCIPNKKTSNICENCNEYLPVSKNIIIIKLGAIGDVIRTTPLLTRYRSLYKDSRITWVTKYPDILPKEFVDRIYTFDFNSIYKIIHEKFDIAINLDKDFEACALLNDLSSENKFGFTLVDGHIGLANKSSEHKFLTGLFDNISIKNNKSYLEEIFEICEMTFNNEPYLLPLDASLNQKWNSINDLAKGKKIIGLNTGCGVRWQTRLWPDNYWINLILELQKNNYFPMVVGVKDEDSKNCEIYHKTGVYYPGHYSLP